jgi:hypothetical protein
MLHNFRVVWAVPVGFRAGRSMHDCLLNLRWHQLHASPTVQQPFHEVIASAMCGFTQQWFTVHSKSVLHMKTVLCVVGM